MNKYSEIPNIFIYDDASKFINDFVQITLSQNGISKRSFSKDIRWPISYIPDLISRRKRLTLERALEFGNFLCLNSNQIDMLIYLSMKQMITNHNLLERVTCPSSKN